MKDILAERLLAVVMGWSPEQIAAERPRLQAMATYKYDEYEQYAPGMRFIESLAQWLYQFALKERVDAYDFIKKNLVFLSSAEMFHLVNIAYPDFIRPVLLRTVAEEEGLNPCHVGRIAYHPAFKLRQRQCLFLGLSDGAHTDIFRRSNRDNLSHEQVLQTHEISRGRVDELLEELNSDINRLSTQNCKGKEYRFRSIIFLEDFSGSGFSCLRHEENKWKGKVSNFYSEVTDANSPVSKLVDLACMEVILVLYVSSEQAQSFLQDAMQKIWSQHNVATSVIVVHPLKSTICLQRGADGPIGRLLDKYYDARIYDKHIEKGGTDGRYGFADGGLPLVLYHNTPNNAISLLWSYDHYEPRGLFPRVSRHREEL